MAALYEKGLAGLTQIKLPPPPQKTGKYFDVYQNYVIRTVDRDKLVDYLRKSGVEILISWPIPMHRQKALDLGHFSLPETESISREVLSLPLYPELSDDEAAYVLASIHDFFKK